MKISGFLHACLLFSVPQLASAAEFTPGNLVILRAGDGSTVIGSGATAVFLDEYTTAGTLVQTVNVSSSGTSALTVSGSASSEGLLALSQDGARIFFAGYRKNAGSTTPVTDTPLVTNRVVGSVGLDGVPDTSIAVTDATGNFRGAVGATASGRLYFATSAGLRYTDVPGPASTSVVIDTRNTRHVLLNDYTLYGSNGATTAGVPEVQHYGILPKVATTPAAVISLAAADAVQSIWFADLTDTVPGTDTLYVASAAENRLRKFTLSGGSWIDTGSIVATGILNLAGITSTGAPERTATIYYTTAAAGTGQFNSVADTSGFNITLTGTPTLLGTVGTNKAFRGICAVPAAQPPMHEYAGSTFTGTDVQLTWTGTPGVPPAIEYATDLTGWTVLGIATESSAGTYKILDTPPVGTTRRQYRIAP